MPDNPARMREELAALNAIRVKIETALCAVDSIRLERPPISEWPVTDIAMECEVSALMLTQIANRRVVAEQPVLSGLEDLTR